MKDFSELPDYLTSLTSLKCSDFNALMDLHKPSSKDIRGFMFLPYESEE